MSKHFSVLKPRAKIRGLLKLASGTKVEQKNSKPSGYTLLPNIPPHTNLSPFSMGIFFLYITQLSNLLLNVCSFNTASAQHRQHACTPTLLVARVLLQPSWKPLLLETCLTAVPTQ